MESLYINLYMSINGINSITNKSQLKQNRDIYFSAKDSYYYYYK